MLLENWLSTDLQKDIWTHKYQDENETLDEWLDRVSESSVQEKIKQLIINKKFITGGRILANKGLHKKGKKVTYSNCYVIEPPEDNIESIFEAASKLARTYSYGGGCGLDISNLAPYKAKVNNAAKHSSGAVSFMDLYSLVTGLIAQEGRRGALMLSIICTHPDLLDFIDIKKDLSKVTKANISIRVLDAFMEAIKNNQKWELSFTRKSSGETITKTVEARELFKRMAEMNHDYAEPGMLYWDRIEKWTLLSEDEEFEFAGVNPCAEEPLPKGGSCLISSLNLSAYVINPFTDEAEFDYETFAEDVRTVTIYMNDLLDEGLPLHPLKEQRESVRDWRQIGIGIMGLADMFIKLGVRYGSKESLDLSHKIGKVLINKAMQQSALIAKEKGAYPKYKKSVLNSPFFIHNADEETVKLVSEHGLRNSQLLTIAPTGSISTMFGISGGGEPIFMYSYVRNTESLHNESVSYRVYTPIVEEYMLTKGLKDESELPSFFNTAMDLDYKERIEMQAVWQTYIDAAVSSTVNVPNNFTVEEVEDLYMLAWEKGLKGITIFRDGCKRAGILVSEDSVKEDENVQAVELQKVPSVLDGKRHKVKYQSGDKIGKAYIHIYTDKNNVPIEVWVEPTEVTDKDMGDALGRMTTQFLRFGGTGNNVEQAVKHLKAGKTMMSLPFIVGRLLSDTYYGKFTTGEQQEVKKNNTFGLVECPECKKMEFSKGECVCHSCGYSKCN